MLNTKVSPNGMGRQKSDQFRREREIDSVHGDDKLKKNQNRSPQKNVMTLNSSLLFLGKICGPMKCSSVTRFIFLLLTWQFFLSMASRRWERNNFMPKTFRPEIKKQNKKRSHRSSSTKLITKRMHLDDVRR